MRTIFKKLFLLASMFSLISCSGEEAVSESSESSEHTYEEVSHLQIEWNDIFYVDEIYYLVYIYSEYCGHCKSMKNSIIDYALNPAKPLYFLQFSNEIPTSTNVENTIGATDVSEVSILGTPTLLEIYNKKLTSNIAGTSEICSFLDITPY